MLTSNFLKGIMTEAYPVIKRQVEDAKTVAGFRDVVAANGGDWAALKALIKAHVEDTLDELSEGKRVRKILDKADTSNAYAGMLGLNMNEQNFSADEDFDPFTGEIIEPNSTTSDSSSPVVVERATGTPSDGLHDAGEAAVAPQVEASPANIQADQANDTHGRAPNNDEASPEVGPQAEASPAGTGAGTLVDRGARFDGEAVSADLPTHSPAGEVAADAVGGSNAPAVPTKLKMNPEFFNEPHPACQRPGFCGGNSAIALCENCKSAGQHLEAAE